MFEWLHAHYAFLKDFAGPAVSLIGVAITAIVAIVGLNAFGRWKRQQVESKRLEVAWDMLSIGYELKYVFDHIRSPLVSPYEWRNMVRLPGESDADWDRRGAFYAVRKRIDTNRDYFERLFKLQPKCMAVLGSSAEEIFV